MTVRQFFKPNKMRDQSNVRIWKGIEHIVYEGTADKLPEELLAASIDEWYPSYDFAVSIVIK